MNWKKDEMKQAIRQTFFSPLIGLIFTAYFPSLSLTAEISADKAQECRLVDDNMKRLLCFDALFNTPLYSETEGSRREEQERPQLAETILERPMTEMILAMERQRDDQSEDWQISIRRWQGSEMVWSGAMLLADLTDQDVLRNNSQRNPIDIFMTMKEAEPSRTISQNDRAVLLLSCDNDITTLGVLLPQPINTLSANLLLSGPGGIAHRLNWRNVESGRLVIAGRGLESIETIKAIAHYPRIQFQVNYPEGSRAFIFKMGGLKERLRAFRLACHW